jgi:2-polyprenyl-3-methyl-5-hydroxy-6-metoxy-1,4-benzoquinol methylase
MSAATAAPQGLTNADGGSAAPCRICGAGDAVVAARKDGYCYRRCVACEFVFLDPMPASEALAGVYDLAEGYEHSYYHAKRASRMRRALFRMPRFLPLVLGKHVLDVGCGGGIQTAAFARFAKRSVGIDASPSAIAYARAHGSRAEFLCADCCSDAVIGRFDFVYASDILEHIVNLGRFLRFLAANTVPGGYLYVATPDCGSPRRPAQLTDWDMLAPPYHVQFFTERNLTRALEQHGFARARRYKSAKLGLNMLFRRQA